MLEHARKIIRALEWTGPIYVEFIETDDGECYFIEINGRYWSSLGCAVASGVDFPWLHYLQFLGINRVHDRPYEIGVKQRRLFYTDIKWLGAELKNGEIGAVLPFITSFFDLDHDVFELDDPLPTAGAVLWAAQQIVESGAVGR